MSVIANDTFTGTNGTNLTAHPLDSGGSWSAASGTATLNASNQATNTTNTAWYTTSTSASDVQITLDISTLAAGYTGVILRFQDSSNFIWCVIDKADFTPAKLAIWTRIAGSNSLKASATFVGVTATVTITALGTSITMSDGTNSCSATISNFSTQTTHGLYFSGGAGGVVDNFKVYNLTSVTLTPNTIAQTNNGNATLVSWQSVGNAAIEDGSTAFAPLTATNPISYYMLCRNFNAASVISADATILGIQVGVKKQVTFTGSVSPTIIDSVVQLIFDGGTLPTVGSSKADTSTAWPSSLTFEYYGGPSDTWSWGGISTANVLSSTFGVTVRANDSGGTSATANVDVVNMTIYYTPAAAPNFFQPWCPTVVRRTELVGY